MRLSVCLCVKPSGYGRQGWPVREDADPLVKPADVRITGNHRMIWWS